MNKHIELITELRSRAAHAWGSGKPLSDAADALEAQAREIASMQQQESELCTLHAMAEAECRRLRAEVDALRAGLKPFADYEKIRVTMGPSNPRTGPIWGTHSVHGSAEITAEDMQKAVALMSSKGSV